jgi:NAD(P)-dependent dehydrogenase (short-subunit alcohol dehydrogenase family)
MACYIVSSLTFGDEGSRPAVNQASEYYKDKVAVVTGGASGIGLALAGAMLSNGAKRVVLADFNDENLHREAARLNSAYPGRVLGIHCDVTKEEDVQKMIRKAAESDGRVDILFNNAGAGLGGQFDKQTNDDWEKAFALNFYGALYGIRAVLPIMRKQGSGHIVNTISGIAFAPMAYQTMYSATKAALSGLTLALRYELWDENIRVTSATPGTVATAIWQGKAPPGAQSPEQSAHAVLAGVAKNERLVLGDQQDVSGAKHCFDPDAAAAMDDYLLNVARKRRSGEWIV